jgi:CubicO group peptidase (beta-lactamase class C family)
MQYAIDKPMAAEPGKVWNYSSGVTELLAYIFQKETGHDIDDYGQKYVFAPLGIRREWKRTYLGVVDTEGGLYLNSSDLAKNGLLVSARWHVGPPAIVSSEWVKESVTPYFQTDEPQFKYGFKWWLSKVPNSTEYARIPRAEPAGVSKGGSDCDLYGLGHSPQLDRQGASAVRLSTSRESQNLHR